MWNEAQNAFCRHLVCKILSCMQKQIFKKETLGDTSIYWFITYNRYFTLLLWIWEKIYISFVNYFRMSSQSFDELAGKITDIKTLYWMTIYKKFDIDDFKIYFIQFPFMANHQTCILINIHQVTERSELRVRHRRSIV